MKVNISKLSRLLSPAAALIFGAALVALPVSRHQDAQPDNTKKNQDQSSPTADQQKMNPSDRAITQKIRRAIHDDKDLSTYAHNVKIITQDGKVTLRGPVRNDAEKQAIGAKAVEVAGADNVTNMIEIAPSN